MSLESVMPSNHLAFCCPLLLPSIFPSIGVFSNNHVRIWKLDNKKGWALKNWCFWTVMLEKILESTLDYKEIKPVHPKGNQSWIFFGRIDAEAETPILWHLMGRADSLENTRMLAKIEGRRRGQQKTRWLDGITDLMGMSLSKAPRVSDGQGSLTVKD